MVGDSIVGIIRHTYVCNESACSNTWNCDLFIYTPKCAGKTAISMNEISKSYF